MPLNPLVTPTDWHIRALQEATKLVGTSEYAAKMVEVRRYAAFATELGHQEDLVHFYQTLAENHRTQVLWLMKLLKLLPCEDEDGSQATTS